MPNHPILQKLFTDTVEDEFELQLVATMLSCGVGRIFTFRKDHSSKYQETTALKA